MHNGKILVLWIFCLFMTSTGWAATFYVSTEGKTGNSGTSESSPLPSLAAAAQKAGSGDRVLLHNGDVFRDSAVFGKIEIATYGDASKGRAIVSGSVPLTDWQVHDGNIYVTDFNGPAGYLFVNNKLIRIARYPNEGWLRTTTWTENSDGTNTVLTSESLRDHPRKASGYWEGANIRWHRHSWWFETRTVTNDDGNGVISLDQKSIIPVKPFDKNGWGFYMDNKFEELDSPGEWYYDQSAGKIYLWAPENKNPGNLLVEVSVLNFGIKAGEATINGITFRHQKDYGLQVSRQSTVTHCLFEQIGSDGGGTALKGVWNAHNSQISHCVFRNNYNNGIGWNENPGVTSHTIFEYDTLINTGTVDGYGGSGPWHGVGIVVSNGSGMSIRKNRIIGTGYAGIILGSPGDTAEYNYIENAMATMNDGGAIYTNCDSSTIRYNLIVDTRGGMESSGPWANLAHGIWPEFLGDFKHNVIEFNTCIRSGGFGLYLPNNFNSQVRHNVFYGNERAQIQLGGKETNSRTGRTENLPQNNTIDKNVLFSTAKNQGTVLFRQEYDYGTLSQNFYCNPYRDTVIQEWGTGNKKWSRSWMSLSQWREKYSWADNNHKTEPFKAEEESKRGSSKIIYNDRFQKASIPTGDNGVYVTLAGDTVHGSYELEPFTSEVLVHTGKTKSALINNKTRLLHAPHASVTSSGRIQILNNAGYKNLVVEVFSLNGTLLLQWRPGKGETLSPVFNQLSRLGFYTLEIRAEKIRTN